MTITELLLKNRFVKHYGKSNLHDDYTIIRYNFDYMKRIHDIIYLVWYDNIKHFGLAEYINKKSSGGRFDTWNIILIPKPIYTVKEARKVINTICN